MRNFLIAVLAMLALVAGMVGLTLTVQSAHAAGMPSPKVTACHAFAVWNYHRTMAHLDAMLTASERAPWNPLGNDAVVVYADVRSGDTLDLSADVKGLAADCR